jgi:hypothetical protein
MQQAIEKWCAKHGLHITKEQRLELFVTMRNLWVELSIEAAADEDFEESFCQCDEPNGQLECPVHGR